MTKKDRAKQLHEILVELFTPEVGNGTLYADVQALSKDCLKVGLLHHKGPGDQTFIQVTIHKPDAVRTLHEAMTSDAPQD